MDYFEYAELKRVVSSLMSYGVVCEIDPNRAKARVRLPGGSITAFLPIMTRRAKEAVENWPVVIDEQVICMFPNGELDDGIILGSIFSKDIDPGSKNHLTSYGDGTKLEYKKESKTLTIEVTGGGSFEVNIGSTSIVIKGSELTIVSTDKVTVKAPKVIVEANDITLGSGIIGGVVTTNSVCAFTGLNHPMGSTQCKAGS